MTMHSIIQSGGAIIGGLVTLGLLAYNITALFSGNHRSAGCSIK